MRTGRFRKGESGNPAGKPKGTRNRVTMLRADLVQADTVKSIAQKLVDAALEGDVQAAVAVLDRVWPKLRPIAAPVEFPLPEGTLADQGRAVMQAVSEGRLSPDVGERLIVALGAMARLVEIDELAARVAALERINGKS